MMKQVLQNLRSGETYVAEVPTPLARSGTALVKTAVSLVSAGTERMLVEFAEKSLLGKARSRPDLLRQVVEKARREGLLTAIEASLNRLDKPIALGYSSAGTIIDLGEGFQGLRVGQRVACAGGGYAVHAEYAVVPKNLMVPLPDDVDFESAAFATLGAIALHGFRLAEGQIGECVAVIGLGLLGLLSTMIARAAGCRVFGIDIDPQRVEQARALGIETVLRSSAPQTAEAFSHGRGCDMVLICADSPSADPVELAGLIARDRARVVAIGAVKLEMPRKLYYEKELFFVNSRSYGPGRYDPSYEESGQDYPIGYVRWTEGRNLEAFVDLLANRQVDVRPLITHRFPIKQAAQAYDLIKGRAEAFSGVLLTYRDQEVALSGAKGQEIEDKTPEIIDVHVVKDNKTHKELTIPEATSRPRKVVLGVLGAGNFATSILLPALRGIPNLELAGIASASGVSAGYAARRFRFRYASGDEQRILNDPDINTVAILTRHHLHCRQVLAAFSAGKNVFCEKPLVLTEDELVQVERLLGDRGSRIKNNPLTHTSYPMLMVGFNRRFAPMMQQLHEFFADRKEPLVAHYRVNAGYLPLNHWLHDPKQGGGRVIGEVCHFIDALTYLVGNPSVSVHAQATPDGGRYQEDNLVIALTFADGSVGTLAYLASGDRAFAKERLEVFCGGRVGVLDDFRRLELVGNGRRKVTHARMKQDKGHRGEWQAFISAILAGGQPPIPLEHILGVTRSTFAVLRSLREDKTLAV